MKKNFLRVSSSYTEKTVSSKSPNDLIAIGDQVVKYLNDDWVLRMSPSDLGAEMVNEGFDISPELARRVAKQIEIAREWLVADKREKTEIVDHINQLSKGYRSFLRRGIDCLIVDGIHTWEQVEKLMAEKEETEKAVPESSPSTNDFESLLAKARKDLENVFNVLDSLAEIHLSSQTELAECIDEIGGLKALWIEVGCLRRLLASKDQEIDYLKDQLQAITQERDELLVEYEKELGGKEVLKKQIEDLHENPLIKRLLRAVEEMAKKGEQLSDVSPEKPNNDKVVLPSRYCPIPVHYQQGFLDALEKLSKSNKKLYHQVLKVVKRICEQGVEKISDAKPLGEAMKSPDTPSHSWQIRVKKWRLTVNINGQQVVFCELFPRDKSPFST